MNKQQGSAHAAVVIVLVVALLGALGFIFWQNFIKKDAEVATKQESTKTTDEPKVAEKKADTKLYDSDTFTFEYPAEGWRMAEPTDGSSGVPDYPKIETNNYAPAMGVGIEAGAYVGVYTHPANSSLAEHRQNVVETFNATELKDTTVGGLPAISYRNDYEGTRYATYFVRDDIGFQIQYQYAGTDPSVYLAGYDMVVKSFKFK